MQHSNTAGCILLKFYIKPQHTANVYNLLYVVSYRNSTSNHNTLRRFLPAIRVVSYRNSTSNHNGSVDVLPGRPVVSYRNSTSNHNVWLAKATHKRLYLIEILHQTTTNVRRVWERKWLYLIEILHQTTTMADANTQAKRLYLIEILHQTTTENDEAFNTWLLYLIEILHQTTTDTFAPLSVACCILSKFYIKPQLAIHPAADLFVVSYRNSTSNHNLDPS